MPRNGVRLPYARRGGDVGRLSRRYCGAGRSLTGERANVAIGPAFVARNARRSHPSPMSTRALPSTATTPAVHSRVASVVAAGVTVFILDGFFAVGLCMSVNPACYPARVFKSVAAGLLGRASFDGGSGTVALGVFLHFIVALGWSAVYATVLDRWEWLQARVQTVAGRLVVGPLYGAVVWLGMNLVVVRLSRATPVPLFTGVWFALLIGHMVVVGPPISLIIRPRSARDLMRIFELARD